MKNIIIVLLLVTTVVASAQTEKRRVRFPFGIFHTKNQTINGFSVGAYTGLDDGDEPRNVHSNGIRLEPIGAGIISPLIPYSPISTTEEAYQMSVYNAPSEHINGLNLSPAGTICDCVVNGFSAGVIGQINTKVHGVSASVFINFTEKHSGVQLAAFNESYLMYGLQLGLSNTGGRVRGLQIGLFNHASNLKGLQLGLWNVNQKRKLPLLNWNFKK